MCRLEYFLRAALLPRCIRCLLPQRADHYRNLMTGGEAIESTLHNGMVEHLNAEVCLRTIPSLEQGFAWLRHTFLYVRVLCSPSHYFRQQQQHMRTTEDDQAIRERFIDANLRDLSDHGLVEVSRPPHHQAARLEDASLAAVKPTRYGELMSQHGIRFRTMVKLLCLPPRASAPDLIRVMVASEELSHIR